MPLKRLALFLVLCSGCVSGPKLTHCILDPVNGVAYCVAPDGKETDTPIAKLENYDAISPDDLQKLAEWMKRNCSK